MPKDVQLFSAGVIQDEDTAKSSLLVYLVYRASSSDMPEDIQGCLQIRSITSQAVSVCSLGTLLKLRAVSEGVWIHLIAFNDSVMCRPCSS